MYRSIWYVFWYLPLYKCDELVCHGIFLSDTPTDPYNTECLNPNICNHTFTVSYVDQYESYVQRSQDLFRYIAKSCCGDCMKVITHKNLTNIAKLKPASRNSTDFVYPVLSEKSTVKKYGYYFIPIYKVQSIIYVTRKADSFFILDEITQAFPLLIVSILLAIMAGFFHWALETRRNAEEFPKALPIGWFEGTWFSFVSMTTVGYGDKAPKSVAGKFLATLWISFGLVLCSMITATITTSLMNSNNPPPPQIEGSKVGMMKYRDFEGYVTAMLGGKKVEVDGEEFHKIIVKLIDKLHEREIDGFVLDKRTFYHVSRVLSNFLLNKSSPKELENHRDRIEYFMYKTLIDEKTYTGLDQYYGILMKNREHYNYFKQVVEDNRFVIQRRLEESLIHYYFNESSFNHKGPPVNILFATDGKYFQGAISTACAMNALFLIIGVIYEVRRRKKIARKNNNVENVKLHSAAVE